MSVYDNWKSCFQEAHTQGFSFHCATVNQVKDHGHSLLELAYLAQGSLTHHINGKDLILQAGDYCIVDYGVTHSYKRISKEPLVVHNLLFHPGFLDRSLEGIRSFDEMMNSYLLRFCYRSLNASPTGITIHDDDGQIGRLVQNILAEYTAGNYGCLEFIRSALVQLLILTMRKLQKKEYLPGQSPEIRRMVRHIEGHYRERLGLSNFAGELGYSVPYLSKKFSQEVGMGFAEYIQTIRLEQACRLLQSTDMQINRIAAEIGYENLKHFNTLFKRKLTLTPREFRDIHKKAK